MATLVVLNSTAQVVWNAPLKIAIGKVDCIFSLTLNNKVTREALFEFNRSVVYFLIFLYPSDHTNFRNQ